MCEITCFNFEEKYDEILQHVKTASFLAIDFEFSGLGNSPKTISMFDEPAERYQSMRKSLSDVVIMQMGISMYEYDRGQNYKVATYVFYLFPRSYPYSPESFSCDSRSLQFLAVQNFDFNKTFKNGLTYVSLASARDVEREIKDGKMLPRLKRELSLEDKRTMEDICGSVYEWLLQPRTPTHMTVDLTDFDPLRRFLIRHHIEMQFKVLTSYTENFKLKVERGSRSIEEKNEELYNLIIGVSGLVNEIVSMKKPIVGHNMFMDLMMFYKTFYCPLPVDYDRFKREIVRIFPSMHDTKLMAFEMKRRVGKSILDTPFNLQRLFDHLVKCQERETLPELPTVEFKPDFENLSPTVHDSGYDSYCTGYIFLQLSHMYSLWDPERNVLSNFPIGNNPACYFRVTEYLKNRVNMMRGKIGHFNLGGKDTIAEKPNMLLVESRTGEIDHYEITKLILLHDTADLRPLDPTKVLIASASERKLKSIEYGLARQGEYKVRWFSPKKKKKTGNSVYIAAGVLSAATLLLLLYLRRS